MKLTWTFYPRRDEKISLELTYGPKLDKKGIWGILNVDSNKAVVCWECFNAFDRGDVKTKKDAFERLTRITDAEEKSVDFSALLIDSSKTEL